jgi:hypothetical protein
MVLSKFPMPLCVFGHPKPSPPKQTRLHTRSLKVPDRAVEMPLARVAADLGEVAAAKPLVRVAAMADPAAHDRAAKASPAVVAAELQGIADPAVAGKAVAVRPVPEVALLVPAPNELALAPYIFSHRRRANAPN